MLSIECIAPLLDLDRHAAWMDEWQHDLCKIEVYVQTLMVGNPSRQMTNNHLNRRINDKFMCCFCASKLSLDPFGLKSLLVAWGYEYHAMLKLVSAWWFICVRLQIVWFNKFCQSWKGMESIKARETTSDYQARLLRNPQEPKRWPHFERPPGDSPAPKLQQGSLR